MDRSLGSDAIAVALREAGYVVRTLRELYGENVAQSLPDVVWIARSAEEGWVCFSKDKKFRQNQSVEQRAAIEHRARVFVLPRAYMTEAQQIERFVRNRFRIALRSNQPGPRVWRVDENRVSHRYV